MVVICVPLRPCAMCHGLPLARWAVPNLGLCLCTGRGSRESVQCPGGHGDGGIGCGCGRGLDWTRRRRIESIEIGQMENVGCCAMVISSREGMEGETGDRDGHRETLNGILLFFEL